MPGNALHIVKIGGNVIDDPSALKRFLHHFAHISGPKILVHGGGKIATSMGDRMGVASEYIDGRRITGDDTIDLVTMVYGGLVNKKIVAMLQSMQCDAIGLTGADANVLAAAKRPIREGIDYGWVGDIDSSNLSDEKWKLFLNAGLIPVVAPLTHDKMGHLLNTNADTIAATLAILLGTFFDVHLIYCFEKEGIYADISDEATLMKEITPDDFTQLKREGKLFAGILPKIENAFYAAAHGVGAVVIGHADKLPRIISGESGTKILTTT